jgi:hypothetical protein
MPISKNLAKIAPAEDLRELPIAIFLADLITRMNWNPAQFKLLRDCGNLWIEIKTGPTDVGVGNILQGYNYAYQVKLVMDSIQSAGLFD